MVRSAPVIENTKGHRHLNEQQESQYLDHLPVKPIIVQNSHRSHTMAVHFKPRFVYATQPSLIVVSSKYALKLKTKHERTAAPPIEASNTIANHPTSTAPYRTHDILLLRPCPPNPREDLVFSRNQNNLFTDVCPAMYYQALDLTGHQHSRTRSTFMLLFG